MVPMAEPPLVQVTKPQALAASLRVARELAGLTQGQAGEAIGVSRQTINSYERGDAGVEPDAETIAALAAAYGTTAYRLGVIAAAISGSDDASMIHPASYLAGVAYAVSTVDQTLNGLRRGKPTLDDAELHGDAAPAPVRSLPHEEARGEGKRSPAHRRANDR